MKKLLLLGVLVSGLCQLSASDDTSSRTAYLRYVNSLPQDSFSYLGNDADKALAILKDCPAVERLLHARYATGLPTWFNWQPDICLSVVEDYLKKEQELKEIKEVFNGYRLSGVQIHKVWDLTRKETAPSFVEGVDSRHWHLFTFREKLNIIRGRGGEFRFRLVRALKRFLDELD